MRDTYVSPTITLDQVTKSFAAKRALEHVTTTIHPREFIAVIGKSGAGKTPVATLSVLFDTRD